VVLLERAKRDLLAIQAVERRMLATSLDRLAMDALPRGAESVEGRFRDHIRLRVGRFRLLYRVQDAVLTVVAIVSG
jgi:mRNA-degrading endonuclease RelE of RelBE toxin-antitoxin system